MRLERPGRLHRSRGASTLALFEALALGWALGPRGELAMDTSPETAEQFARALGYAVVRNWSRLPHDVQDHLFEEVVTSQGGTLRSQLAVFLQGKHPGISDLVEAGEIPEPDSLGG